MRSFVSCALIVVLLAFGSMGCSTFITFGKVYGGTRVDAALINAGTDQHPHNPFPAWMYLTYALVDLPFSLVMDTVLLPITIPWYFISSSSDDDKETKEKAEEKTEPKSEVKNKPKTNSSML